MLLPDLTSRVIFQLKFTVPTVLERIGRRSSPLSLKLSCYIHAADACAAQTTVQVNGCLHSSEAVGGKSVFQRRIYGPDPGNSTGKTEPTEPSNR